MLLSHTYIMISCSKFVYIPTVDLEGDSGRTDARADGERRS